MLSYPRLSSYTTHIIQLLKMIGPNQTAFTLGTFCLRCSYIGLYSDQWFDQQLRLAFLRIPMICSTSQI